jgi:hypothetical protein
MVFAHYFGQRIASGKAAFQPVKFKKQGGH